MVLRLWFLLNRMVWLAFPFPEILGELSFQDVLQGKVGASTGALAWVTEAWPEGGSVQLSCSCLNLCNCTDCSTPGFPVHHQLLELAQTHVHRVSDALQRSHPLSSPSPPFNLSQHQGLFQWVSSSHQVAKVLAFQLYQQSFQWILGLISFRMDWLDLLAVQRTLKVFSNTAIQKHQLFDAQLSL